jgi:TetR/AcrR family transcriptional repressor of uid operon
MSALASKPAAFLSAALAGEHGAPADPTAERILDAALELSVASGIRHLTIDDVAARAGVGRMTVYRRLKDKAGLLNALAAREGRRCLDELAAASDPEAPLAEQITEGFVAALRIAREHPLLARMSRHEPETFLESLIANDSAVFKMARAFAAARMSQAPDGLRGPEAEAAAEVLIRLTFSFVLISDTVLPLDDPARAREVAARLLAPVARARR